MLFIWNILSNNSNLKYYEMIWKYAHNLCRGPLKPRRLAGQEWSSGNFWFSIFNSESWSDFVNKLIIDFLSFTTSTWTKRTDRISSENLLEVNALCSQTHGLGAVQHPACVFCKGRRCLETQHWRECGIQDGSDEHISIPGASGSP